MHKTGVRLGWLIFGIVIATSALALGGTRYKWRDADGNLHYGDSLPASAVKHGYEVINAQGVIIKRVARQRTSEEQATDKIAQAHAQAQLDQTVAQERDDRQMLAAYPKETDLQHAQQQQALMLEQNINSLRANVQSQEESLAGMLGHAADLERSEKPVPAKLVSQIGDLRSSIETQKQALARRETEHSNNEIRFAEQIKHYRALQQKLEASRN